LMACRQAYVDPKIAEYRGRIVNTTGDGLLVDFGSAVDAVRCAIEIQENIASSNAATPQKKRIEFRIGIHVGDIIIDDNDIFGDGVNIAARLEGIAEPGGVCISDDAYRQIRGKIEISYHDMGPQALKNITEPIRAWRARSGPNDRQVGDGTFGSGATARLDRPSIAVLPFQNMSGDPQQEYFADGIVEDILTELSRFKSLHVVARNTSFTYKGRSVDIKQAGRELGVRYILEGSVRHVGKRARVTGQLIDTATGAHIWADRFDGDIEAVFELQDEITKSVVGAVASALERAEVERSRHKPSAALAAYDHFVIGMADIYQGTRDSNAGAIKHFAEAIRVEPEFGAAYAMSCYCHVWRKASGWPAKQDITEIEQLARTATRTSPDDAFALCEAGFALAAVVGHLDEGALLIDRALALNSNMTVAWRFSGYVRALLGESDKAIDHLNRAIRLNPTDPMIFIVYNGIALAHFFSARYNEALSWADKAALQNPEYAAALVMVAVSAAMAGHEQHARAAINSLKVLDASYRLESFKNVWMVRSPDHLAAFERGLRLAGLPE
jgi:TolB-like protein